MTPSAYRCLEHRLGSRRGMAPIMAATQTSLCIRDGPVFGVDIFNLADQDRTEIFMVAHHLCVDMVSWRIIAQDLSEILDTGSLAGEAPISFRSWCALQSKHNEAVDTTALLPFSETPLDSSYWGDPDPIIYGATETETFNLSKEMTKLALSGCHAAFRSEPIDVFLATLICAFARVFGDRDTPTIHVEHHGREAPDEVPIDLSRTVGWFTTMYPLVAQVSADDALDAVRLIKDLRRTIPGNGRPYFAHRYLSHASDKETLPMEVLFNYLGVGVNHSAHTDSILQMVDLSDDDLPDSSLVTADVGPETKRLALFEISAMVIKDRLQFRFTYDKNLRRVAEIRRWIADWKLILEETVKKLMERPAEPTLSDYPLLSLTYRDLHALTKVTLPSVGVANVSPAQIEDIYPCTPVQEGMLIGQLRNPNAYIFHAIYSVRGVNTKVPVNAERIRQAWNIVVRRHAALRTIFIESVSRGRAFDQVVLSNVDCTVVLLYSSDEEAVGKLNQATLQRMDEQAKQPQLPHRLSICTTNSGRVLMKLEVNHVSVDGSSLAIILEELAQGYGGTLSNTPGPLYSEYVKYIRAQPTGADIEFWKRYLHGLQPCHFPKLNAGTNPRAAAMRSLRSTPLPFDRFAELRRLSEEMHVTFANTMHAAWAFVLRTYTRSNDVCFGYLSSDRDVPVENIRHTVGTLINMLCCRIHISQAQSLEDVFHIMQDQHLQSLSFQRCSLARVQHELGMAGKPLYNTSVSTQIHTDTTAGALDCAIAFEMEDGYDPSEVRASLIST